MIASSTSNTADGFITSMRPSSRRRKLVLVAVIPPPLTVPVTIGRDVRAPDERRDRSKSTVSIAISVAEAVNDFAEAVRPKLV